DDDVIEALAADAPEKSLADRVHQRRLHGGAHDTGPGARGDAVEGRTKLIVAVPDEELRHVPERRCVAKLLRGPRLRWSARSRHLHDALGVHVDDEEHEDGTEPDIVGLQEVAGPTVWFRRKVRQRCPERGATGPAPRMRRWIVRVATRTPPFKSSPRIRSAPQSRFSVAMRRMRATKWGERRGSRGPLGRTSYARTVGILPGATAARSRA